MKNSLTLLVALLVVVLLLSYGCTFQVRYDEVAVLTTFDKATDESIKRDAGLYARWPWPIQKAYKYSTRVQILEDQSEEQQTADGAAVVVKTYLTWRIDDPLKFFVALKNTDDAQRQLRSLLRDVRGVISQYRFDQMVNVDPDQLKLREIEDRGAEQLRKRLADQDYGIKIEQLGIRRIVLPEKVTEKVFESMKATRQRLAAGARAEGKAQAASIKSNAENASQRILAQAERRALALRTQGDREAVQYYETFAKNSELAILIERLSSYEEMFSKATFVIPADQIGMARPLQGPPATTPSSDDSSEKVNADN